MATTACSRGATGRGLLAAERKGWGSPATRGGRAPARVEAQEQAEGEHAGEEDQPELLIDNLDPVSTVLTVRFGNKLGTLSDTVQALSDLGLNIARAQVEISEGHRFYITDASTGAKILDSTRLEEIRMTVLQTMMLYHPEARDALSESYLSLEEASKPRPQQPAFSEPKQRDVVKVSTSTLGEGTRTLVNVETSDRPGLLNDIVNTLEDLDLTVISAEIDTKGTKAVDAFYVSHRGTALNPAMEVLVVNTLRYHLTCDITLDETSI